jgi:cobalt/nickel transport system permease protein
MHIAEGIITGWPVVAYTLVGIGLMAIGTRGIKKFQRELAERRPLIGMGAAIIFFISLIPVPAFTGTTSHPCGTPLVAILLGPRVTFALTGISLLLQAAFFAHGGFGTWGANLVALGFVGGTVGGARSGLRDGLACRFCSPAAQADCLAISQPMRSPASRLRWRSQWRRTRSMISPAI